LRFDVAHQLRFADDLSVASLISKAIREQVTVGFDISMVEGSNRLCVPCIQCSYECDFVLSHAEQFIRTFGT
jgi:hypothetical protein